MTVIRKKERLARAAAGMGALRMLESLPGRQCLAVLNYHRIGDPARCQTDPGVFSATADEFEDQVRHLRSRYRLARLEDAHALIEGRAKWKGAAVLLTFDDGYLDNYQHAFPILRHYSVPAVFFLATSFTGSTRWPWWDRIAWMLRQARTDRIILEYPRKNSLSIPELGLAETLRQVLRVYKMPQTDPRRFFDALAEATGAEPPEDSNCRLFLDWDEAAQMARGGMEFGSHTHSHEILSRLSAGEQMEEVASSRRIMQDRLGLGVSTFSYPVGARSSFSEVTFRALQECGYRAAFSFYGGINLPGRTQRFDIRRIAADWGEPSLTRFRLAAAGITGGHLLGRSGFRWN
jgi:peptidoglycan/xylan/chitin deacetylase (PgdA/CDA1 family)